MPVITRPIGLDLKELPGLIGWWDFSDPATYGPLVSGAPSTIGDKSGHNNLLTVWSGTGSPIAIRKSLTGRNAIDGTATSLGYTSVIDPGSAELMVCYAAMYPAAVGGGQRVIANNQSGGNWLMGPYSNNWAMFNGGFVGTPGAFPIGTWAVHTGVVSAIQNSTYHHGNGALQGVVSGTGYTSGAPPIGVSFSEYAKVFLGEVLILLTSAEAVRLRVQDYLMRRWGAGSALAQSRLARPALQRRYFAVSSSEIITLDKWFQPPRQPLITRPEMIPY